MRLSVILSLVIHCLIILAGFIVLPEAREFVVKSTEALPVDIVKLEDIAKKPKEKPKPKKKVAKPKPPEKKQATLTPPEPMPPEPKPEVKKPKPPEPKPVEVKPAPKPAPKPEKKLVKKPDPKPAPKPRVRPRPPKRIVKKKPKFDLNKIAALINRDPDLKPAPQQSDPDRRARLTGPEASISNDELNALRAQVERCWNPLVGVQGAEDLLVRLKITFKRDGRLQRPPEIVNSNPHPSFPAAADRAIRALRQCQPFNMPAEKYKAWREIILNFNPKEMIEG